jgi:hypothetical protein
MTEMWEVFRLRRASEVLMRFYGDCLRAVCEALQVRSKKMSLEQDICAYRMSLADCNSCAGRSQAVNGKFINRRAIATAKRLEPQSG